MEIEPTCNGDCRPKKSCASCYNEYMREYMLKRYHRRRQEFIDSRGGVCEICFSDDRLEIDHKDRNEKSFNIAKGLAGFSEARIQEELKKCWVLCYDCHKEKTLSELGVEHGGGLTGKRGCKCNLCKEKKNEYMREFKRNKREKERQARISE